MNLPNYDTWLLRGHDAGLDGPDDCPHTCPCGADTSHALFYEDEDEDARGRVLVPLSDEARDEACRAAQYCDECWADPDRCPDSGDPCPSPYLCRKGCTLRACPHCHVYNDVTVGQLQLCVNCDKYFEVL